jgi:predicted ArsR family transcriptional regulator
MSITNETRRESYEAVKPTAHQRRAVILEILGDREMTANEIAEILYLGGVTPHYERNFAAPRLTELKAAGKVKTVGKRLCPKTGRKIAVWKRVDNEDGGAQSGTPP